MRARLVVAASCAVAAIATTAVALDVGEGRTAEVIEVVVPPGAGEVLAEGGTLDLLPQRLEVRVGDRLVIDNRDDEVHQVGPYVVAAEQRLSQSFTSEGSLEGVCTIHPSGEIRIVVRP